MEEGKESDSIKYGKSVLYKFAVREMRERE